MATPPEEPKDVVLVYTRKGEKMLDPLKKKFDEAGLSVYVHEDFDCTGLPNLEKQIIGANSAW